MVMKTMCSRRWGVVEAVTSLLNTISVHNIDTVNRLARDVLAYHFSLVAITYVRGNYILLLCNFDDPLLWGFKGFLPLDAKLACWVIAAKDICFKNSLLAYVFLHLGVFRAAEF
ncbi:Uncharacterized protein TCM_014505 [Theobroma cacao]|uniref:Tafazzin family protein n=1 Tax=Theobroma cacao TaxID=3641 RepID=A0A061FYG1_THECC|nr:Uncharacterized protein TCM_014505 [Theobroma cacao]